MPDPVRKYKFCLVSEQIVSRVVDTQNPLTSSLVWYQICINSLLSTKKLTEQSHRRAEAGDEVMMIKRTNIYWIILFAYVSMLRLHLTSTHPTSSVLPNKTTSHNKPWVSINIPSYLLLTKQLMKPHNHQIKQWKYISKENNKKYII